MHVQASLGWTFLSNHRHQGFVPFRAPKNKGFQKPQSPDLWNDQPRIGATNGRNNSEKMCVQSIEEESHSGKSFVRKSCRFYQSLTPLSRGTRRDVHPDYKKSVLKNQTKQWRRTRYKPGTSIAGKYSRPLVVRSPSLWNGPEDTPGPLPIRK